MRQTYDHQGMSEHRADTHTHRLMYPGMMHINKYDVTIFPFSFKPMHSTQLARASNLCPLLIVSPWHCPCERPAHVLCTLWQAEVAEKHLVEKQPFGE